MGIEKPKPYEPSEEEIKKAESTMTDNQKRASKYREEDFQAWKEETGKEMYLEKDDKISKLEGAINGHKIELVYDDDSKNRRWMGKIDGQDIPNKYAKELYVKFHSNKNVLDRSAERGWENQLNQEVINLGTKSTKGKVSNELKKIIDELLK